MPTYDYKCSCGNTFEHQSKIEDRDKPCQEPCPSCKKKEVERSYGIPAICDPVRMGVTKAGNGFKEAMSRIKEKNPGAKLDFNKYI